MPAVTDMEAALEPARRRLYDQVPGNLVFTWTHIGRRAGHGVRRERRSSSRRR